MKNLEIYAKCAQLILESDALLISGGIEMSIDSDLPKIEDTEDLEILSLIYERLYIDIDDLLDPNNFILQPKLIWGFYGKLLQLCREASPYEGFEILKIWIEKYKKDYFVLTQNNDGLFQKAGFQEEKICEFHGSIHDLQCLQPCQRNIWKNRHEIILDERTMHAQIFPHCEHCENIARPNILLPKDHAWVSQKTNQKMDLLDQFIQKFQKILLIELGVESPAIRSMGEEIAITHKMNMIRINIYNAFIQAPHISINEATLEVLKKIDTQLSGTRPKSDVL